MMRSSDLVVNGAKADLAPTVLKLVPNRLIYWSKCW